MKIRGLVVCGVLAPVLYVIAVILGGLLWPGYSHLSNFISDLIGSGAPNKRLLDPIFAVYNVLLMLFALGVFLVVRIGLEHRRRLIGLAGATVLVLTGVLGFLTLFFPEDPVGTPMTSTGTMHIVLAGLSSLSSMCSVLFLGLWFRDGPSRRIGIYSFVSVGLVFVTGGITAAMGATHGSIVGLMERLTIGSYMQWIFVVALILSGGIRKAPAARSVV